MGKRSRKRTRTPGERPAAAKPPSRTEQRNAQARAKLEPLKAGERPTAVTVAAVVAFALAAGNVIAWLAGFEIDGKPVKVQTVLGPALLMLVTGWGMWRARYWAVLGMEALLALVIVTVLVSAVTVKNVVGVLIILAIILPAGALFWFLIKAMARIQMPERG